MKRSAAGISAATLALVDAAAPSGSTKNKQKQQQQQRKRQKRKRAGKIAFDNPFKPEAQNMSSAEMTSLVNHMKGEMSTLVKGINAVTRGMEKNQLSFVVICGHARSQLLQHLPVMASMKNVPLFSIPCTNRELGKKVGGIKSLACFGVRVKSSATNDSAVASFLKKVTVLKREQKPSTQLKELCVAIQ